MRLSLGVVTLTLFILALPAYAQNDVPEVLPEVYSAFSDDSRFFAMHYSTKIIAGGGTEFRHQSRVYHVRSRRFVSLAQFTTPGPLKSISFSPLAQHLLYQVNNDFYIFHWQERKLQLRIENAKAVVFSADERHVYASRGEQIVRYKLATGEADREYKGVPATYNVSKLDELESYNLLLAWDGTQLLVWQLNSTSQPLTTLPASAYQLHPEQAELVCLFYADRKAQVQRYSLPSVRPSRLFTSQKFWSNATYAYTEGSSLSPSGHKVAFAAKRFSKTMALGVYDTESHKKLATVDTTTFPFSREVQPYEWINEEEVALFPFRRPPVRYNLKSGKLQQLVARGRKDQTQLSADYRYLAIAPDRQQFQRAGEALAQNALSEKAPLHLFDDVRLLGFSPDNEFLFFEDAAKANAFYIKTSDLSSPDAPPYYYLSTVPYQPGQQEPPSPESPAPAGFRHTFTTGTTAYSSPQQLAELDIKQVVQQGNELSLEFHLLDEQGQHLQQANPYQLGQVICKTEYRTPNGWQAADAELAEAPKRPLAFALALDHSGSMGSTRATLLQQAIEQLIDSKEGIDRYSFYRYDHRVVQYTPLEQQKPLLRKANPINGLGSFGGATALLDAGQRALQSLSGQPDSVGQALVLFTDGQENSSLTTLPELAKAECGYLPSVLAAIPIRCCFNGWPATQVAVTIQSTPRPI